MYILEVSVKATMSAASYTQSNFILFLCLLW